MDIQKLLRRVKFEHFIGIATIVAALIITTVVVMNFRKPGSMTVLESQAMDASQMLPPKGAVPVELVRVERKSIEGAVTYTGTIQAYDDEDIYPRVTGRIVKMPVYPGDRVRAGQLLVQLDPSDRSEFKDRVEEAKQDYKSEMHNASAEEEGYEGKKFELEATVEAEEAAKKSLASAKSQLEYWIPEIKREQALLASDVVSKEEYDSELAKYQSAQATVQEAEARVRQAGKTKLAAQAAYREAKHHIGHRFAMADKAKAALDSAQIYDSYTRIFAHEDGVVTKRLISPGVVVSPGMMILKVAHIRKVRAQAQVAESDADKIRVGTPVNIKASENSSDEFKTEVSSVFPAADPASRTIVVEALIDNGTFRSEAKTRSGRERLSTSYKFLPGQYVVMRIVTGSTDGLVIPSNAIVWREGQAQVWKTISGGGSNKAKKYQCLMHPEVISDKPGKCPKCGMDLELMDVGGEKVSQLIDVKLGISNQDFTQVTDGLADGDEVISSGYAGLKPGMPIVGTKWSKAGPKQLPMASEVKRNRLDAANHWAVEQNVNDVTVGVSLTTTPLKTGSNTFEVKINKAGNPIPSADIVAKTSMPSMGMAGPDLHTRRIADGTYELKGDLTSGLWQIDLTIKIPGRAAVESSVELEVP